MTSTIGDITSDGLFLQIHPALVRLLDGDVEATLLVAWLRFRASTPFPDPQVHDDLEGNRWVRAPQDEAAALFKLSEQVVRRRFKALTDRGVLLRRQGVLDSYDRSYWYRVNLAYETDTCIRAKPTDDMGAKPTDVPYKKLEENSPSVSSTSLAVSDASTSPDVDHFDRFWSAYPRKVRKPAARKAFVAALKKKGVTADAVIEGAERYRDDPNRTDQYTAHPSSWLNDERWNDDPLPGPKRDRSKRGSAMQDRAAELAARARRLGLS